MTKTDITTKTKIVELDAYRDVNGLRAIALRRRAEANRQLAEKLRAPLGLKDDLGSERREAMAALLRLIAVDCHRVESMQALLALVKDSASIAETPSGRIAQLVADRDYAAFEREELASSVWHDVGLLAGLHACDPHGDIVDAPVSALG